MKFIVYGVLLFLGLCLGSVGTFLMFKTEFEANDEGWGLMLMHTQVRDFVLLNDKSDRSRYCLEYNMAISNVKILNKKLEPLKNAELPVTLSMNVEWAQEAIESFNSITEDQFKYDCTKP